MSDKIDAVVETGQNNAAAGEEFFEPHKDAYADSLFRIVANHNDVVELAEQD
ncbi:hypothetical protein ACFFX1_26130 [Dactylosporangium sucinum]|uniref:Uncharacterized protein n=1 Tax=Dactylosporangium sucinum TaxID=1424081 RepID=A0A917T6U3_9ACTN|nr:hypothetical protein [Dactylosporangium sucinum]GGM12092.1 hypothetical protein GCM10007977_011560 [Dactylosporangium sucinum]